MDQDHLHPGPNSPREIEIFAHKGCGTVTEENLGIRINTLQAFQYAADLELNGFETDVSLSRDGEPIIIHPREQEPNINNLNWPEIQKDHPHVPHLIDLMSFLIKYPNLKCLLDIKQDSDELVEKVVDWLKMTNLFDRVYLTAPRVKIKFAGLLTDMTVLEYARSIEPRVRIHIIDEFPFNINKLAKTIGGVDIISFGWLNDSTLSKLLFSWVFHKKILRQCIKLRHEGTPTKILSGITETEEDIRRVLICTGGLVDIIQTDDPETAVRFLRK